MLYLNIRKRFEIGGQPTFNLDVAFTAKEGITILFGPSGSGKTTILRAIAGIITPDEGKIRVGELAYFDSITFTNLPIWKRRVGFVFQEYILFPHLTAEQNITFAMNSGLNKEKKQRAHQLLSLFELEHKAGHYPNELSGGEQQRTALARAMASDPSILLLDEPLSAVDSQTRSRLLEEIIKAQRNLGIPFIYVTHNHGEAAHIGDYMYILHRGQVVQEGNPVSVFNTPQSLTAANVIGTENIFVGIIVNHKIDEGITTIEINGCQIEATYHPLPVGSRVTVGIRSEDIIVSCEYAFRTSARNVLEGIIKDIFFDAEKAELIVTSGVDLKVSITLGTIKDLGLQVGAKVFLLIKARACHILL